MRGSCAVLVCCLLQGLNAAYYQQIIAYGNDISDFQKHEESQTTTTGLGNDGGGGGSNQDDTPAPPPHDQTAMMSRYLVHYSDWLSMATISTRGSLTGTPFANVFSFSDGPTDNSTGVIYMYLTEMEMSVKDLHRNTKASVTISMEQVAQGKYCKDLDAEDPRCAHIILAGDVAHIKKDTPEYFFAKKSLFSRHPIMPSWPEWHGWGFAKLKLTNIILLDYFGGAIDVPIKDYYNVKILVVAVSSKLSNSQNRRIIRSTWKNTLPSSVLFKFVLSETSCNIDPLWRLNQDGCEHWDLVIPKWMRDGSPIVYFSVSNSVEAHKSYPGIYFKVKTFPILVHKIGLLSEVLRNLRSNYSISLILEDSRTGQTIQNISFSTADKIGAEYTMKKCVGRVGGVPGGLDGGGLEIPPNFQGLLYFQSTDTGLFDIKCSVKPENQLGKHGIIILTGLLVGGGGRSRVPYSGFSCPLINLEYSLPEPTDVRQHLSARETQNTVEERRNKETEKDLNVEIEDNDDMIFLPTTDTPSSIPRNTKMFLSYLSSSVSFDYVLLTTDDALLNIDTILSGLDDLSSWWSSFVLFSAVEEPDIKLQAASFPPRPRAKSSVISKQLADFVARNCEILEDFSSLSRSLAVWFAGLNPRLLDDDRWVAVGEEAENGLGEAEITRRWKQGKVVVLEGLSAQQMESVWKD